MKWNFNEWKLRTLSRLRSPLVLGMHLSDSGAHMVLIRHKKNEREILCLDYPEKVLGQETAFRQFLQQKGFQGIPTACNLDHPSLKIQRIDLPKMPHFDLREAVKWEIRDQVEDPIENYSVRYSILDEYAVGAVKRLAILVFAVHKEAVRGLIDLLKKLSLKPELVEPTPVALLAAVDRLLQWEPGKIYGLIDLSFRETRFLAVGEGKLFFIRNIPEVSREAFLKMLSAEMALPEAALSPLVVDLFGKNQSLHEVSDERLKLVLPLYYSRISVETQRSVDSFSIQSGDKKIERLFLTGDCALLPGLADHLAKNVGIPVSLFDPLQGWAVQTASPHLYSVATGLALYSPAERFS